ncbi:hypothetical protein MTO96_025352 [Rhipicephalus appendiculatus]
MRFSVTHACKTSSGRCGEIRGLQGASDAEPIPTPMCLLYTHAGSVPHLTYDMLHKIKGVDHHPALFPLPPIASFANSVQEFGAGISKFSGMPTHPSFIRIQDPMKATPSGFNDKAGVSIWDQGGRVHLNVPTFMRIMEAFKPSCYQALCDSDTPKDATRKRLQRSVERTTSLLDQCIAAKSVSSALRDTCILGTVVGGYSMEHRHASVMEISKRDVDGYVIEGVSRGRTGVQKPEVRRRERPLAGGGCILARRQTAVHARRAAAGIHTEGRLERRRRLRRLHRERGHRRRNGSVVPLQL